MYGFFYVIKLGGVIYFNYLSHVNNQNIEIMEVLREIAHFKLNKGDGMARGLYNLTNDILLEYTENEGCSDWFGEETKDELLELNPNDFIAKAKEFVGNGIYSYEVAKNYRKEVMNYVKDGVLTTHMIHPFGGVSYKGETIEEVNNWFKKTFK